MSKKIKTLVGIIFILNITFSIEAIDIINCKKAQYDDSITNDNFIQIVTKTLNYSLTADPVIQAEGIPSDETFYQIHLNLKRLTNKNKKVGIVTEFTFPNSSSKIMVLSFDEKKYPRTGLENIARNASAIIIRQLKVEANLLKGVDKLSPNMFENTFSISSNNRNLQVDILNDPSTQKVNPGKKLLGRRGLEEHNHKENLVLDYKVREKYNTLDPSNPIPKEPKNELTDINPFQQNLKSMGLHHTINYPSFNTSGILSTIYFPSLSLLETDLTRKFNVSISSSVLDEKLISSNPNDPHQLYVNGTFYKQNIAFSGHLWRKIRYHFQTGLGVHDSDLQFDIKHPTATGTTTFLSSQDITSGFLDSTLSIHQNINNGNFIFRPVFYVKMPTGKKENLLGSGHADFGLSFGTEYIKGLWHASTKFSFTRVGELNIFDVNQAELDTKNVASANFGIARRFQSRHNESLAVVLNISDNPLKSNSSDLDEKIVSIASLWEKRVYKDINMFFEPSMGLSDSAPDFSLSFSVKLSY